VGVYIIDPISFMDHKYKRSVYILYQLFPYTNTIFLLSTLMKFLSIFTFTTFLFVISAIVDNTEFNMKNIRGKSIEGDNNNKYMGCKAEESLLGTRNTYGSNFTDSEFCSKFCKEYRFFYIVEKEYCYCLKSYENAFSIESKNCDKKCPGNKKESCGGSDGASLYKNGLNK